jgi:NTE family protein
MDEIATAHAAELPRMMRLLMRRMGVLEPAGARVLSYLLFEQGYCRHLMHLGYLDAMEQSPRILNFLGYDSTFDKHGAGRPSLRLLTRTSHGRG